MLWVSQECNLLIRIHLIILMIWWTGLVPWKFEFPFKGSLTSTFQECTSTFLEGRRKVSFKREFEVPWREAGPPNHHGDKVDSDQ